MKNLKYVIALCGILMCCITASGQDVSDRKFVRPVYIQINGQNPDNDVYEFDDFDVRFKKIDFQLFRVEITNKSDQDAEIMMHESYTVTDGKTGNIFLGGSVEDVFRRDERLIIGRNANRVVDLSAGVDMFNLARVKKKLKSTGKPSSDKLVIIISKDGDKSQLEFIINSYLKKID